MTTNGAREARFALWWETEGRFIDMNSPHAKRLIFKAGFDAAMGQQYRRRHDDTPEAHLDLAQESTHG
jgi:hypothetical protein